MENFALVRAELAKQHANGELSSEQVAWADDACIRRYLRARGNNPALATKQLKATLIWRADFRVDSLTPQEFPEEFASGKMYLGGTDDGGRPVLITRKKADMIQAGQHDRYLRHLVFTLEAAVTAMAPGVEQWVWIMDLAGYSRANSPPLSVSYATMKILADHYPERLKTAFIVDAPSIFYFLWKALAPFIDPVTKGKVKFVYSKDIKTVHAAKDIPKEDANGTTQKAQPSKSPSLGLTRDNVNGDFSQYIPSYRLPYNEVAYRGFLGAHSRASHDLARTSKD